MIKMWHIVLCAAVIYLCMLTPGVSLNGDDSDYILLSRSLAKHEISGQPFLQDMFVFGRYYVALPIMLIPFAITCPNNYLAMKSIPFICAILSIIVLYIFLGGILDERRRKMVTILYAFNPWISLYSGMILTDTLYLLLSLVALFFVRIWVERKKGEAIPSALGAISALSIYTRPFGLALTGALAASFALIKRWKALIVFITVLSIILIPIICSIPEISRSIYKSFIIKKDYYASQSANVKWQDIILRVGRNLAVYVGSYLPDIIARPVFETTLPRRPDKSINPLFLPKFLFGSMLAFVMAWGYMITLRPRPQPMHVYVIFHLAINVFINVYVARYLISLLPFALLFLFVGLEAIERKIAHTVKIVSITFAVLLIASLAGDLQNIAHARTNFLTPAEKSFVECNDWVKANTKKDVVILSRKPSTTAIYTGRTAVGYLFADDPVKQMAYIDARHISHIIIGDLGFYLDEAGYVMRTVNAYPNRFKLLYATKSKPVNYVYEVMR